VKQDSTIYLKMSPGRREGRPRPLRFADAARRARSPRACDPAQTEQPANADSIVYEAVDAGLDGSEPFVVNMGRLRAKLLSVKADLERELERVAPRLRYLPPQTALRRRDRPSRGPFVACGASAARDAEARS
jgi:hypothetical protein